MDDLVPAVVFPPGEYLLEILNDRGWTQIDFAEIIGRSPKLVNEIVNARTSISPTTAKEIAAATDTNPRLWLNLENEYRLHHEQDSPSPAITRHAKLRQKYPIREMAKRGWIENSPDPVIVENQVCAFFGVEDIDEQPRLYAHAAKRAGYPSDIGGAQLAWLFRVRQIAEAMKVRPYSERTLRDALPRLQALRNSIEDIRHIPHLLAECGVRLVVVEPMPGSKIDGVTFWLGEGSDKPVIGLSLRLDRIDNFWFVLAHEIAHVLKKHGQTVAVVDVQTFEPGTSPDAPVSEDEETANAIAAELCVSRADMADFILRNRPLFSHEKVLGFARRMQVHPGLVVGQLQRALGDYRAFRKYLVSVRPVVAPVAMTDGYGQVVPLRA